MKQARRRVAALSSGQEHSLDNYLFPATSNLSSRSYPKKSVDANKMHDSHWLMLTAWTRRRAQGLCLNFRWFQISIWTLAWWGVVGHLTVSQDSSAPSGGGGVSCRNGWNREGVGDGAYWLEVRVVQQKGKQRSLVKKRPPVMSSRSGEACNCTLYVCQLHKSTNMSSKR